MHANFAVNQAERIRVRSFRYARRGDYKRFDILQLLSFERREDTGPWLDQLASF